jgi:pyrimidine-specific ribonucleoside hydrolase
MYSMKRLRLFIYAAVCLAAIPACNPSRTVNQPVKIIFDTDFGPDYDDVGALAFLHAMADSGKAEILATVSSNQHELVAPCINIMNIYFNRPDLPIGSPKSHGVNLTAGQHWPDTLVAKYPHTVKSNEDVPDAVSVYRKVLYSQPDTSVTIVTVGFLTNLAGLLQSAADSLCPLSGKDLILKKVKKLVSMAGRFPSGNEFNVHMDSTASVYVYENWPTPVTFTGFEIGEKIHTGLRVMNMDVVNSPVRDVFRLSIPMSEEDKNGRMSWDETAVLIAVYGTGRFFNEVTGTIRVNPDGSNGWVDSPDGKHVYVVQKMPADQMVRFIEDRMMHQPVKKTQN